MIPTTCEWRENPEDLFCHQKVNVQVETMLSSPEEPPGLNGKVTVLYCCRKHGRIAFQLFNALVADINGNYWGE